MSEEWMQDAACKGKPQEPFFPDRGESTAKAKAMCATCPVSDECLAYAMDKGMKVGIWGGKSERQRRELRIKWRPLRHCRECRKEFRAPPRMRQFYCSHECERSWHNRIQRQKAEDQRRAVDRVFCITCGAERGASHVGSETQTCSPGCARVAKHRRARGVA
jgi:WhiB family redox-sensing transcriptional regulator